MQLPVDFIHGMKGLLGESDYSLFFEALQQEPPVSIRLNTKFTSAQVKEYQSVSWCKNGYYLPSRPLFTADPLGFPILSLLILLPLVWALLLPMQRVPSVSAAGASAQA